MLEKINRFWKAVLIEKNRKTPLFAMIVLMLPILTGCSDKIPEASDIEITQQDGEVYSFNQNDSAGTEHMAEILRDIYEEAVDTNTLGSLDMMRRMVARLGDNGYVAVDSGNQIDMTQAEQVFDFCKAVDEKEMDALTIIVVMETGIRKFDLKTEDGSVNIVRGYYEYDQNGSLQNRSTVSYPADFWQYTEEGYLIFEGSYFSEEGYRLTLSDTTEHTMLRVSPLDEKCREYNRKYILPVGYERNNLFLCNWSEDDFGDLDFYDLFDRFYPMIHSEPVPYMADENLGVGAVYQVPGEEFENVIGAYFHMDCETLRSKTTYHTELDAYEYRPRGFYEVEYPDIAYPEVVSYRENEDGTVTLYINAVYPNGNMSKEFSHTTVIRPLGEDSFQYVSNEIILPEGDYDIWWHTNRLTEEEWKEVYGGTEPVSILTAEEEQGLQDEAMWAAKQCMELYQGIEIAYPDTAYSRIENFTEKQRKDVVKLLGGQGFVSVSDDMNMENYQNMEDFYSAYVSGRDAMITVFDVYREGNINALTFIHRNGKIQTYYVLVGWQEGGIPEVKGFGSNNLEEIRLTEKGYFIYTNTEVVAHGNLREYYRVKPLSDECRELTRKHIYGLSFVNYNMLVTNWDADNVEEILMPRMFEDIYRVYTDEPFRAEGGLIPADIYERVMTTCFPVSVEQVRDYCGYHADADGYEYEMVFARQFPPFGEVVDYKQGADGTITLYVDGVWIDYNSDCAFTNQIVVQPFPDGTFRYLSNKIEQKELELPQIGK